MPDDPAKPPRFPYVAALLCAACVAAAVWTWMRYSYAWPMRPTDLRERRIPDMFVRMQGTYYSHSTSKTGSIISHEGMRKQGIGLAALPPGPPPHLSRVALDGRLVLRHHRRATFVFDPTASRFHGGSIAGLVVGAMGVFVLTVALRHWLRERRKLPEEAGA